MKLEKATSEGRKATDSWKKYSELTERLIRAWDSISHCRHCAVRFEPYIDTTPTIASSVLRCIGRKIRHGFQIERQVNVKEA